MSSFCSYFNQGQCRSCDWIEQDYSVQIGRKEEMIRAALEVSLLDRSIRSSVRGFRNRAKMTVTGPVENAVIGLTGETELDQGRELLNCPIHHPKLNELIATMPAFIREYNLYPYQIAERKGELKGLIAFYSPNSGEIYLRFILRSKDCVSRLIKMLPALQKSFPHVTCVSANLQPVPHAILEGPEEIFITQIKSIHHPLKRDREKFIPFELSPRAFVQTNMEVATELYQTAARWIGESGSSKILDLYCGQGAFSFFVADPLCTILGVEINQDAVKQATETARKLGLNHLKFKCADATQIESEIEDFAADLILVNPPRKGLGEGTKSLLKHPPKHLIYSSCSLESLETDLKILKSGSYRIKQVQLFDMFPQTRHFETLVWLER